MPRFALLLFVLALVAPTGHAQAVPSNTAVFPPSVSPATGYALYDPPMSLKEGCVDHHRWVIGAGLDHFSPGEPLPDPGQSRVYTFTATLGYRLTYLYICDPDNMINPYCPRIYADYDPAARVSARLTYNHASGPTTYYDIEVLYLHAFGSLWYRQDCLEFEICGDVPSTGQYVVRDLGEGHYDLSGYLDLRSVFYHGPGSPGDLETCNTIAMPWHMTLLSPVISVQHATWGRLRQLYR